MARSSRQGSEAELTRELIWQPGSDAVKLRLVCNTKLHCIYLQKFSKLIFHVTTDLKGH